LNVSANQFDIWLEIRRDDLSTGAPRSCACAGPIGILLR
jgi:hypothetical protein